MIIDHYLTISGTAEAEYKEKASKFLAYAFPFDDENEMETIFKSLKSLHPKARHFCYAYKIGIDNNRFRVNDDGEPSGTAGKPIFGQILSANLSNILIVVVRYFGGTKLGASGLIQAYKEAAQMAIQNSTVVEKFITQTFQLSFDYFNMGHILNVLKDLDIDIISKHFDQNCKVLIQVRKSEVAASLVKIKARILQYTEDEINSDTEIPFCKIEIIES